VEILKKLLLIAGIAAFPTMGHAADMDARAPYIKAPAMSVYDWTGFYLGGSVGGVRQQASTGYSSDPSSLVSATLFAPALDLGNLASSSSQNGTGVLGGVTVGYNWQQSSLVYGIEGDWSWTSVRATSSISRAGGAFPTLTTDTETRTDWLATVRGRIGFLAMPQTLLFATGGLAVGEIKASTNIIPSGGSSCATNAFCSNGRTSSTRAGWTVGAGVEQALASNWTVKVEYLHYDLGSVSYIAAEASPALPAFAGNPNLIVNTRVSGDIGRFGANYRF
jgi:outer membrane immunogenic protein